MTSLDTNQTKFKEYTSRLDRQFVLECGNNNIDATPTAIELMFAVSTYVDFQGLIQLTKEEMRKLMDIKSTSFFERTLDSAIKANLIKEKDGSFFSLVHTFKPTNEFSFIQNYTRLIDGNLPKVGKWALRLFTYILSAKSMGYHVVNIENLYNNKLHTASNGLNYFPDAKRVVDALVRLLQHDLITVELPTFDTNKKARIVLDSENVERHREMLEKYVEIQNDTNRKIRTSANKANTHVLYIKLSSSVTGSKEVVKASRTELHKMLREYNYSIELLRENTVTSIIGVKNSLYAYAGNVGLSLYCKSLKQFLSQRMPMIDIYEQQEFQVYNHFLNYYVISSLQCLLLNVARDLKKFKDSNNSLLTEFVTPYGKMTIEEAKGLLIFFNERASRNHNVILENLLHELEFTSLTVTKSGMPWENVFSTAHEIRKEFIVYEDLNLTNHELRQFVYELATKNLLHIEERYKAYVNQFKKPNISKDELLSAADVSTQPNPILDKIPKKVKFYNWLEDIS